MILYQQFLSIKYTICVLIDMLQLNSGKVSFDVSIALFDVPTKGLEPKNGHICNVLNLLRNVMNHGFIMIDANAPLFQVLFTHFLSLCIIQVSFRYVDRRMLLQ